MGLFDAIFRPKKSQSEKALNDAKGYFQTLTAYQPSYSSWQGEIYESELVRASIDAIARHISKLNIQMVGSAQPKLQTRLRFKPNSWSTWSQFMYRAATILYATNTCFIVPVLNDDLDVIGYTPVLPQHVQVIEYKGVPFLRYQFANGQVAAVEFEKCAVLTRHQFKDDFFGSDNNALSDTMAEIHINSQGVREAVKSTSTYRFMAQVNNFGDPKDIANERQRFTEMNLSGDAKQRNGLLLFPNTYKDIRQIESKPYTINAGEMEQIRKNVFNYFGVNEEVRQNSAVGDKLDAFFNGCIEPFAIQFSEAMTKAIYTEMEQSYGAAFLANANRLQYMTVTEKVNMAKELGDRGAILIDEVRALFNYPPLPDGAGQHAPIRGEFYMVDEGREGDNTQEESKNE